MFLFRIFLIGFLATSFFAQAQKTLTKDDAVQLALANQRNLKAAQLTLTQQQQLLTSSVALESPQLTVELSPFEPLVVGLQQNLSLPSVYRNRKAVQNQRILLAQLQLQGAQYELKKVVRLNFLQLQFFKEQVALLRYQDSVYRAIKNASIRFFNAGQINKLEELQARSQADAVNNELVRAVANYQAEEELFRFYTGYTDSLYFEPVDRYVFVAQIDSAPANIQQQILQQEIVVGQNELQLQRTSLLPELSGGVLVPVTNEYKRPLGFQLGLTIPIWQKQNRSRVAAAQTAVDIARAQQELEQQRLKAQYRQALANYQREVQSLDYFNTTALPQAKAIIETSQRLFHGGELNYIESLRNLQSAFEIFRNHLDTHKAYNEAVINLAYLTGTL